MTIEEERERLQKAILGVFSQGINVVFSHEQLKQNLCGLTEAVEHDLAKGSFVASPEEIEKAIISIFQKVDRGLIRVQPIIQMTKIEIRKPFPHPLGLGITLKTEEIPTVSLRFLFFDQTSLFKKTEGE